MIKRLRKDDKGVATCHAPAVKFPVAHKMLERMILPGPKGLTVYFNSLSLLLAEKVQRSPLFYTMLQEAMKTNKHSLTLIIFSDEANPGNVLHARHPRKTNLVYASFLELHVLFVDSMWLPVSAVRADDVIVMKLPTRKSCDISSKDCGWKQSMESPSALVIRRSLSSSTTSCC